MRCSSWGWGKVALRCSGGAGSSLGEQLGGSEGRDKQCLLDLPTPARAVALCCEHYLLEGYQCELAWNCSARDDARAGVTRRRFQPLGQKVVRGARRLRVRVHDGCDGVVFLLFGVVLAVASHTASHNAGSQRCGGNHSSNKRQEHVGLAVANVAHWQRSCDTHGSGGSMRQGHIG